MSASSMSPGETLHKWLIDRSLTQAWLSRQIHVSTKHINQLCLGRATLSYDFALKLENVTGISARKWCILEVDYRLSLLRRGDR